MALDMTLSWTAFLKLFCWLFWEVFSCRKRMNSNTMWRSLAFHSTLLIPVLFAKNAEAHFAFEDGRHVILNPDLLTWDEAVSACRQMNGTLLTVFDAGTLIDLGITGKWIVWVGLKISPGDTQVNSKWVSGERLAWINWPSGFPLGRESCTTARTFDPHSWTTNECATKWPSLCELRNGTCKFEVNKRSSLVGFTKANAVNVDLATCREKCQNSQSYTCLSFGYNSLRRFCQVSDTNRWMNQANFASFDKEWDYYHRQCYSVYVNESLTPNAETVPAIKEITTQPIETSPAVPQETRPGYICISIDSMKTKENETEEIRQEVKELQELGEKYKQNRRAKTKESIPDDRPSARYLGTIALAITLSFLLAIVVLDLLTLTRHCSKKKAKPKKKIEMKRRSFSNFAAGRVGSPTWPSPVSNVSDQHDYSSPADLEELEIHLEDEDKNREQEADIDSDNTNLKSGAETLDEMTANSYVSWPYGQTSPVLYPFYRSKSEKANLHRKSPNIIPISFSMRHPRSKSDSFFNNNNNNKRIYVVPGSNDDGLAYSCKSDSGQKSLTYRYTPGLTRTEQLVMAYGHHFEGEDKDSAIGHSLDIGKLRRGSHC